MRKFLSCGLITAFAIIPTALKVYAEAPPGESVVVVTKSAAPVDCGNERCSWAGDGAMGRWGDGETKTTKLLNHYSPSTIHQFLKLLKKAQIAPI